jgi:predicted phosphodiesterase
MMLGLVSDAHGNPTGLSRCLDALAGMGAASFRFLGDAVGYLPGDREVLDALRAAEVGCQLGNHEGMLLGMLPVRPGAEDAYRLDEARSRLSAGDQAWLRSWPDRTVVRVGGRDLLFVHGSPAAPLTDYVYPDSDLAPFARLPYHAVFMGNTHRPFVTTSGPVLVVNVGSCGLPRDSGDLASCILYDPSANDCDLLRIRMTADEVLDQFPDFDPHPVVVSTLNRRSEQVHGRIVTVAAG